MRKQAEHPLALAQREARLQQPDLLHRQREPARQRGARDLVQADPVGGAPKDYDVATDATPEQVRALFRNCRLIGRRFRLAHVVYGREIIEVATFRANGGDDEGDRLTDDGGRLLRDNIYGSIEDDAIRRDFTANALYYAIEDFSVRDYTGGYADVQARLLRLIGEPEARYREDPVRMLRAARLAAKLGFTIEAATAEPLPRLAPLLAEAAPARLFEETLKLFLSGHAVASFELLEATGLLPALLPETAQALASNKSGALRRMLVQGLRNTDARVAAEESVSPAFLYAVLLWPAYCRALALLQAQGVHAVEAQRRAADQQVAHRATDQVATEAGLPQSVKHAQGVRAHLLARDAMHVARDDVQAGGGRGCGCGGVGHALRPCRWVPGTGGRVARGRRGLLY